MKRIGAALVAMLALTGCSAAAPTAKPFTTHYGESAVTIANHITGCKGVALADIRAGVQSGMASSATCTLGGRKIVVDSWKDASAADMANLMKANNAEMYWASGTGWTAFEVDDSQIQLQLTNDASALMKSAFDKTQPTADTSGEHEAATLVAHSLNGRVNHFVP